MTVMAVVEGDAAKRVSLARQLAEVGAGFRDAARRRKVARNNGDLAGEAQAESAIEACFRTRDHIVRQLAELGVDASPAGRVDTGGDVVRPSRA